MKKILLLFGVAISGQAMAQQGIFDLQKHLQNRNIAVLFPSQPERAPFLTDKKPADVLSYTLSNGDVVLYGFGKMPVVKTDMNRYTIMPNASAGTRIPGSNWPGTPLPGEMPNAAKPLFFELWVK